MIIAIDESGNFNPNSNEYHIFAAAHIQNRNGSLEIKKRQFENWEKTIPTSMKDKKGEIKGQKLGKVEIKNFIKNVVYQKPEIRFTYVSIIPNKNKKELINKHKQFETIQIKLKLESIRNANERKANINFVEQLSNWTNKRNEIEYLKLLCLQKCLYNGLHNTFIYCEVFNLIDELLNIEIKIDKDFISNEDIYWKIYSLRSIQEMTKKQPLPMLNVWEENHPIRKKYIIKNEGFNLKIPFKDNLKFVDSKDNFEIRIVDIAAIVYNRYWNKKSGKSNFEGLKRKSAVGDEHYHLILNDFDLETEIENIKKSLA